MAWATEADILALTGVTVDAATLAQAQGVVELFAGISEDNETELSGRNTRMLRAAVAYQAVWTDAQVDVTGRMDVAKLKQDGAELDRGHRDALVLAPLAQRALDRLSWRGRRSTALRLGAPVYGTPEAYTAAWLRDDTADSWTAAS